jgi:hypothetical protein
MASIYFKVAENSLENLKKINKIVKYMLHEVIWGGGDWSLPPLILNLGPRRG